MQSCKETSVWWKFCFGKTERNQLWISRLRETWASHEVNVPATRAGSNISPIAAGVVDFRLAGDPMVTHWRVYCHEVD